jgi:flagellar motility protein MotE (MotC chaperone)
MKASLFSPILVLLILALLAKASMLFGRVQEQTTYAMDTNTSSILVNTAYASSHGSASETPVKIKQEPMKPALNLESKNGLINNLTRSEIDLLKELSKRRDSLDKEKTDLSVREQVLKATESKIDKKVSELKDLQTQLENLMKQYDQKENSKILSLVKIYETMKPKDAAKIFNELEMPVLLRVVSNMKEVKVAPVIASMQPAKARELSIELSKQKPIN